MQSAASKDQADGGGLIQMQAQQIKEGQEEVYKLKGDLQRLHESLKAKESQI